MLLGREALRVHGRRASALLVVRAHRPVTPREDQPRARHSMLAILEVDTQLPP
jgi:hypothetical protein